MDFRTADTTEEVEAASNGGDGHSRVLLGVAQARSTVQLCARIHNRAAGSRPRTPLK